MPLPAFAQEEVELGLPGVQVNVKVGGTKESAPAPQAARTPPPMRNVGADRFSIDFDMQAAESLRVLSPEGARVELWADDGSLVGEFDAPGEVKARPEQFYRVRVSAEGALVFDRKVELRRYHRTTLQARGPKAQVASVATSNEALVDFAALRAAVEAETFSDAKLAVVRSARGRLTVEQVGELLALFSFSADQLKLVEACKARLVDPENAPALASRFTFEADRAKLRALLAR
jgi:hypothetical protein